MEQQQEVNARMTTDARSQTTHAQPKPVIPSGAGRRFFFRVRSCAFFASQMVLRDERDCPKRSPGDRPAQSRNLSSLPPRSARLQFTLRFEEPCRIERKTSGVLTPEPVVFLKDPHQTCHSERSGPTFFLPRSLLRTRRPAQSRNLSSLPPRSARLQFTLRFEGPCQIEREKSGVLTPEVSSASFFCSANP